MITKNPLIKLTMTYGLYLGGAFSAVVFIMHLAGKIHFPGDQMAMFNAFLLTLGIIFFGKMHRDRNLNGIQPYRQAFGFSFLLVIFSGIIYSFFSYWYYLIIEPNGITAFIDQLKFTYTQSSGLSEDQIESLTQLYRATLSPGAMAFTVFFTQLFAGTFISLFASFFIKTPLHLNKEN